MTRTGETARRSDDLFQTQICPELFKSVRPPTLRGMLPRNTQASLWVDALWVSSRWILLPQQRYKFTFETTNNDTQLKWTVKGLIFNVDTEPCDHMSDCAYDGLPPEGFGTLVDGVIQARYEISENTYDEGTVHGFKIVPQTASSE